MTSRNDVRDPEPPEVIEEFRERPEIHEDKELEAPDAGERRCDPSEEYFTHGRSWS
jgi:hypothetical protein